jgi:ParB family transcriptional regulator, chromosome partitioning protein
MVMTKAKGLGRGLDALLGNYQENKTSAAGDKLITLTVDALQPGKYQPRSHLDETSLRELADSIKTQGVMQPILVRPLDGGRYEIIAGERRWRAARIAGLSEVPAIVRAVPDNIALAMSLIENIQREELNPLEQATGIQRLIAEFGMTHDKAAEALGCSRSAVSNLLRLLALAKPVRELVEQKQLDMGHARTLLALSGMQQIEVARRVVARGLSVRDTERLVAHALRTGPGSGKQPPEADRDVLRLQEELAEKLGTRVAIKAGAKGRGALVIHYATLAQLDEVLARLMR